MALRDRLARGVDTALDRLVVPGYTSVGYAVRKRLPSWPDDLPEGALRGRHVLVTGATSGLGKGTAAKAAELGAQVHLVVRDLARGHEAAERLAASTGAQGGFRVWQCNVSDLDSVRRFAADYVASGLPVDALVHNAGAMPEGRDMSRQGHELTMATHVLGPVLMTELLLPALRGNAARVVFVTSGGQYTTPLPVTDPQFMRGEYSGPLAYARSKRTQVELLNALHDRWDGVSVYAVHPGWADSPGVESSLPVFHAVMRPWLRDDEGGVDTTVWLLGVSPRPLGGGLWHDRRERPIDYVESTVASPDEVATMWAWVREQVGLS